MQEKAACRHLEYVSTMCPVASPDPATRHEPLATGYRLQAISYKPEPTSRYRAAGRYNVTTVP